MTIIVNGSNTPTAGAVGYGDGTNLAFTSAGTIGQFLSSNGSSAPSWVGAPASAMTLISTQTASNTILTFTGLSGYKSYQLILRDLVPTSGFGGDFQLQFGFGSTPTWATSGYYYAGSYNYTVSAIGTYGSKSYSGIGFCEAFGMYHSDGNNFSAVINIGDLTNSISNKTVTGLMSQFASGSNDYNTEWFGGTYVTNTNPVTAIRIVVNGNNTLSNGTASLYGISS